MRLSTTLLALAATTFALPQGSAQDPSAVQSQPYHHHHKGSDCCPEPCPPNCGECLDNDTAEKLAATWL
jgi:hypothetical protein